MKQPSITDPFMCQRGAHVLTAPDKMGPAPYCSCPFILRGKAAACGQKTVCIGYKRTVAIFPSEKNQTGSVTEGSGMALPLR